MAHHLQLWFLAAAASLPACETARARQGLPEVDQTIALAGKERGLSVVALEIGARSNWTRSPPRRPTVSRDHAGGDRPRAAARGRRLRDAAAASTAKSGRPKCSPSPTSMPGLTPQERAAEDEFTRLLLVGRNEVMAERAAPLLAEGGAFIAVGALHLSGKDGLIERFRAAGYRVVERVVSCDDRDRHQGLDALRPKPSRR